MLASSANVYGLPEGGPVEESAAPKPLNHYATSKLAMEHMARTYASRLPLVMTRPFNYTGRGQSEAFVVPKIVGHFARRAPVLELGNVDVARDFSDVRDVARMYRLLLERDIEPGTVVNLASGFAYSLKFVLEPLCASSGFEPEIRVNPAFVRPNDVPLLVGSTRLLDSLEPWALSEGLVCTRLPRSERSRPNCTRARAQRRALGARLAACGPQADE